MNLHIIQMFQTDSVFFANAQSVPRQMRIIGGMAVVSADPSAGKNRVISGDFHIAVRIKMCIRDSLSAASRRSLLRMLELSR